MGVRTVRERNAIEYHTSTATMALANAIEYAQKQRGSVLPPEEYAEIELTSLATMYMVLLDLSGFTDDEKRQKKIMEAAQKVASEKLSLDLETEVVTAPEVQDAQCA